ncbi:lecithin:cholesterol acyltransferase [Thermoanaerobacter kivui]|uniref:Lecithin:cholesterol acyltransferase n=1 Tax=Thermoanaerobacter kivui TaxID=2325 RepID=A0A097ATS3_THEKI|nr:alpha/beta hydrolase [Thermoanaerobacter kivui]AIS53217.1 lecithin:cholesterol acyltransferase [Thermoanaerobacter kivui]
MNNPVVFVHGIFGSVFTPTPLGKMWSFGPAAYVYNPFIENLNKLGFVEGKNLFVCYYEWWKSVPDSIDTLKLTIEQAKAKTGSSKVDLICHSMGGLLARSYIQSDKYQFDVDKLIFLATPHFGSANAYYGWEGGTVPPDDEDFLNMLFKGFLWVFSKIKGDKDAITIIRKYIPSIKDLMPSKEYGNYLFMYPTRYDKIVFKNVEYMKVMNDFLNHLNEEVQILYDRIKNIYVFSGDGIYTNNFIQVENSLSEVVWPDGKPIGVIRDNKGDGTVLKKSALGVEGENFVLKTGHIGILNDSIPDLQNILGVREKPAVSILEKIVSYLSMITDKKIVVLDRSKNTVSYDIFGKLTWHLNLKPEGQYRISIREPFLSEIYIETNKSSFAKKIKPSRFARSSGLTLEVDKEGNFRVKDG